MNIRPFLLRLLMYSAPLYVVVSVLSILNWSAGVISAILIRAIFDAMTGEAQAGFNVYTLIAFTAVLYVVHLTAARPTNWVSIDFLWNVLTALLQRNLLRTMLASPPPQNGFSPGDLINRFRDDVKAVVQPILQLTMTTGIAVTLGASVYLMLRINPAIAVVAVLPGLLVVLITKILGNRIDSYRQRSRTATSRGSGSLGEFLGAVQALQVANAIQRVVAHFEELSHRRRSADLKEGIIDGLIQSLSGSIVTVSTGVVLLLAAQLMRTGSFTVGDFAFFVAVVGSPMTEFFFTRIGQFLASLRRAQVSFQRLFEILPDSPPLALVQGGKLYLWGPIPDESYQHKTMEHRLESLALDGLTYKHLDSGRSIDGISLSPNPPKDGLRKAEGGG